MATEQDQKNNFVIELRDYLQKTYQTKYNYTCGAGDFEVSGANGTYTLILRSPNKPKNISGFYFRKDLCFFAPQSEKAILENINTFSSTKTDIESKLEENNKLTIKLGNKEYIVISHIEQGYAGEIGVYFMELPNFSIKVV